MCICRCVRIHIYIRIIMCSYTHIYTNYSRNTIASHCKSASSDIFFLKKNADFEVNVNSPISQYNAHLQIQIYIRIILETQ